MSRLGWVKRAADVARNEECNAESNRLRCFENHGGMIPDDDDAVAVTILDRMCREIRKARHELEAYERLGDQSETYRNKWPR